MLNAVLAALHLLNIRKEFCFCLFVFLLNMRICFVIWKILFLWVEAVLKSHHKRYTWCCHRGPPRVGHWCPNKAVVSDFGGALWSLQGLFSPGFRLTGRKQNKDQVKVKPVRLTEKKLHDWAVNDHSLTQIFVHGTMMALESDLLWCLSIFFFHLAF